MYNPTQQRHKTFNWDGKVFVSILHYENGKMDLELLDTEPTQDFKSSLTESLTSLERGYWVPDPAAGEVPPEFTAKWLTDEYDENTQGRGWPRVWRHAPLLVRVEIRIANINGGDSARIWSAVRAEWPD